MKSGGMGFLSILAIAFIILKLCNVIAWNWFLVLSPIWVEIILIVFLAWLSVRRKL